MITVKNENGFTLIEILAGIFILGIILTVFFQFFIFSQKTTTHSKDELVALNLANSVLEKIVANEGNYLNDINDLTNRNSASKNIINNEICTNKGPSCSERYLISADNNHYAVQILVGEKLDGMDLYTVTVEVYLNEIAGKPAGEVKGLVELWTEG